MSAVSSAPGDPKGLFDRLVGPDGRPVPSLCPEAGQHLVLFLVEIPNLQVLRRFLGEVFREQVCSVVEQNLLKHLMAVWEDHPTFSLEVLAEGTYLLYGCLAEPGPLLMPERALALRLSLRKLLLDGPFRNSGQFCAVQVGYALVGRTTGSDFAKSLRRALFEAQRAGLGEMEGPKLGLLLKFRKLLEARQLAVAYQPVVNLERGDMLGWEARVRGPQGSVLGVSDCLFAFAEDAGEAVHLDRLCREKAVEGFGAKGPDQKLFVQAHRVCLADPKQLTKGFVDFLVRAGLTPADVVVEFSALDILRDFPLALRSLAICRESGFKVGLEGFGPDRLGLGALAEIRPKFVKLDLSLMRLSQIETVKQALIETYVTFANHIGSEVVACGIESKADLDILSFRGVRYGQGDYLAPAATPKTAPNLEGLLGGLFRRKMAAGERMCSIPIGDLAEPIFSVSPDTSVDVVREAMTSSNEPLSAVVVVEDERPVGLIMSHHLNRHLSEEFGRSVYYKRPVSLIMDSWPLLVDAAAPVEQVARQSMLRDKQNIFDYVIVAEDGRFKGVVSVQKLLDSLAGFQVEMAKGANPLTGLPGNLRIEQELERRVAGRDPFIIIYADLDNFKVYNDVYGFVQGDGIILLLGRVMAWAIRRHGQPGDFLGHVGGDDFVGFTAPDRAERICQSVVRVFGRLVRRHFTPEDLARGCIRSHDRRGQAGDFPLTTVSLGILECAPGTDPQSIAQHSSETKTFAKTLCGNSYVYDRRIAVPAATVVAGGTERRNGPGGNPP